MLYLLPIGIDIACGKQVIVSFDDGTSGAILCAALEHKMLVFSEVARFTKSCCKCSRHSKFTLSVAFRFFNKKRL